MIGKILDAIIIGVTWSFYIIICFIWLILITPVFYHLVKFVTGLFK
jgi:hypothetical protein